MSQANRRKISVARSILAAFWYSKNIDMKQLKNHPYLQLLSNDRSNATFRSTLSRLFKAGKLKKERDTILLTEKGRPDSLLAYIDAESSLYRTNFFQKWDNAWRIVIFDIPEKKRPYRDYLRKILKRVGFKEMQRSIWVNPYPVPSFLGEILYAVEIKPYIRFITTDSLYNDDDFKKLFNL